MIFRIIIWLIILLGGGYLGLYLDELWFKIVINDKIFHIISFIFGFFVLLFVLRIAINASKTRAKYGHTASVPKMQTNTFVNQGMYKYMRHPMYFGLLFLPMAIALILGSPTFILVIAPAEIILILILVRLFEEPLAFKKYGSDYKTYARYTPKFCFKKRCLNALFKKVN